MNHATVCYRDRQAKLDSFSLFSTACLNFKDENYGAKRANTREQNQTRSNCILRALIPSPNLTAASRNVNQALPYAPIPYDAAHQHKEVT